jgi:peptidyl-prolyl cis-trans isomerase A (cyclophilin A)
MSYTRTLVPLFATVLILAASLAHAAIGIQALSDQYIPSGKTLVVSIPAIDPTGPARSYTVQVGPATASGSTTTAAGIVAAIRTGDPHFVVGVSYTDSNSVLQTGTMEFQLLREFAPVTTQIVGGLAQGGFYSPKTTGTGVKYMTFHRVIPGFVIQGGDPNGDGSGGPGFDFENEFSNALIFSGSAGQLAMANAGTNISGATNGSQFFVTLAPQRSLDYGYNIFGQLLRGYDALNGIAGTTLEDDGSGNASKPVNQVDITSATVTSNNTDAVLMLSATGVCDATITVTASSGSSSSVQTSTAHAVADAISDAPFLRPVPDFAVPDGKLNVTLQGTDLQLDLLRYGYQRLLPTQDISVTSGKLPRISIALTSGTQNTAAAALDHWNASTRGFDFRIFHAGAGDKPLRGSLSPIAPGRNGSLALSPYPVAVFTAGNSKDTAASFTASVNWGDGTYLSGTDVSIVKDTSGHTVNRFNLMAGHAYMSSGEYPIIVKIADTGGARLTLTGTANIGWSSIAISAPDIFQTGGTLKDRVVATFSDSVVGSAAGTYSTTIDWGDGSVTPGVVKAAIGSFQILGSHVYKTADTFTVCASVSGSSGNTASAWSAAHISGVKAPQVFPPFPQAHLAQVWSAIYSDSNSITTTTGTSYQIDIRTSVAIVNSGNKRSSAGSFAVYVDPNGTLAGGQTIFTSNGQSSFPVPALEPGKYVILSFDANNQLLGSSLKLPVGFDPTGQAIFGVVTYSDPVGDFDGSQKIISPGSF